MTKTPNRRRLGALSALALVGCLSAVSCGSVVQGTPLRHPETGAVADASGLNPGNYPTTPLEPLGEAGDQGYLVEARRMGENLVMPFQLDPELRSGSWMENGILARPEAAIKAFPKPLQEAVDHNYITGITALRSRGADTGKSIGNTFLRFATPEDAAAAAADLTARAATLEQEFSLDNATYSTQPIPIPGHPDTTAVTWDDNGRSNVLAFTARGPFVLAQRIRSSEGPEAAAELVNVTLNAQIPQTDAFQWTPVDEIPSLPMDPEGILARTLPPTEEDSRLVSNGFWGPHAALISQTDPEASATLFAETGLVGMTNYGTNVYLARDEAGAEQIVEQFNEEMLQSYTQSDSVPGLPESLCGKEESPSSSGPASFKYYCLVATGRHAIEVSGGQEANVHQMTAAQYLLLNSE